MKRIYLLSHHKTTTAMKNLTLLLLISILCLSAGCKKDDDSPDNLYELPDATQTGENTFGCLVNGEPWVAEIDSGVLDPTIYKIRATYDEIGAGVADNFYFSLSSRFISLPDSVYDIFSFYLKPIHKETEINCYDLERKDISLTYSQPGTATDIRTYILDTLHVSYLNITTLDTVINVCSGEFEFRLINNNTDTITISEGRFDVIYQQD